MQGVEIFIAVIPEFQFFYNMTGQEFIHSIIQENLLDKCRCIVARVVAMPDLTRRGRHAPKRQSAEEIMREYGLDPKAFKDKLCK